MNSQPSPRAAGVDEQAASWAARLDGGVLDRDQRAALDAWLARDPANRAALSDYCQFSTDLEEQLPKLIAAGTLAMPPTREAARRRWSVMGISALGLAAAAIAVVTWILLPAPQVQNVATAVAERRAQTLADGTRVELNAHTSIRFENSAAERRVRLAGEALFAVAKDPTRPFIVETPGGAVRVTGTTFNVRNDTASTVFEVTVIEGSVQVRPSAPLVDGTRPISLAAGEQLTAGASGLAVRPLAPAALEDILAWREGQIVFEDVPLRDAAARFARYHGRTITVSPAVADKRVGGRYSIDDFSGFLAALEVALPVKVAYDMSGVVSLSPRR